MKAPEQKGGFEPSFSFISSSHVTKALSIFSIKYFPSGGQLPDETNVSILGASETSPTNHLKKVSPFLKTGILI